MGRKKEKNEERTETTVKVHTIENKEHICLNSTSLKMFAGSFFSLFLFLFFSIWFFSRLNSERMCERERPLERERSRHVLHTQWFDSIFIVKWKRIQTVTHAMLLPWNRQKYGWLNGFSMQTEKRSLNVRFYDFVHEMRLFIRSFAQKLFLFFCFVDSKRNETEKKKVFIICYCCLMTKINFKSAT